MPGIDHFVICHRLHLDPTDIPIIQLKWNHETKRSKIIEAEIDKLKDANFIVEVHHQLKLKPETRLSYTNILTNSKTNNKYKVDDRIGGEVNVVRLIQR